MAQLVLSNVGRAVGAQASSGGVSVLGQQVSGAAIGETIGALAGAAIDQALFAPRYYGPRIADLHVTQSREGAAVPNVYGRMRVGGNVIWAARFNETSQTSGGKGGPRTTSYVYTLSFAVALCEGPVSRVTRIWANGDPMDLQNVNWRFYPGDESQAPDALIEAVEGAGQAPAYRGTAYVVFEDQSLEAFGNRMPQLSFEVERPVGTDRLEDRITGVNLIPGSGEFAYATDIIQREISLLEFAPENMHTPTGDADFVASLDHLLATFPYLSHVNLIVGWFGDSLDCAQCQIRPGVERRDRKTKPRSWSVAGLDREHAWLVSQDDAGRPRYGGTPDDASVKQAIAALKARGLKVMLYPFLFMDTPGLDWRGRVACADGHDGTSAAAEDISAFFGDGADWRYRRFIGHYAQLADEAGGVDAFLIGSEMVGLTRSRSGAGQYPAVSALKALAAECRAILGPYVSLSYAADWTEYGAYAPADGSGDVDFPLDELWADPNIDFVGLDWYPPLADWREGRDHADAQAGYTSHDRDYLAANLEGGEAYDWYYASDSDRALQARTPIVDTAHGEDWIFRQKDVRNWWSQAHHSRPGGVRSEAPTAWVPQSKPVRFVEFGCPAVDKGANQPNVFYDPKSAESALPHFSNGSRDDLIQRRALEVFADYWSNDPMLDADAPLTIWAWDMRPWPNWPLREDVWSDGGNWRFGHWLNGRTGLAMLADVVDDLGRRAGVEIDASRLSGLVSGYGLSGVMSVRDALEPLKRAFDFGASERPGGVEFRMRDEPPVEDWLADLVASESTSAVTRVDHRLDKPMHRIRMSFIDAEADHQPGMVLSSGSALHPVADVRLPLVLDRDQAERLAESMKSANLSEARTLNFALAARSACEPGDHIDVEGEPYRISRMSLQRQFKISAVRVSHALHTPMNAAVPTAAPVAVTPGEPLVIIADAPPLPYAVDDDRPLVFATARPWSGAMDLSAGPAGADQTLRASMSAPSDIGRLVSPLPSGPPDRWQHVSVDVEMLRDEVLQSRSEVGVYNGANLALVGRPDIGWELLQFLNAELIGDSIYRLSGLLRGLQGSEDMSDLGASTGDWFLPLNSSSSRFDVSTLEYGLELSVSAMFSGPAASQVASTTWRRRAARPWRPAHLAARLQAEGLAVSWIRRSRLGGDGWDVAEPASEWAERYRINIVAGDETVMCAEVSEPQFFWPADDMANDPELSIQVAQLSDEGVAGPFATIHVSN